VGAVYFCAHALGLDDLLGHWLGFGFVFGCMLTAGTSYTSLGTRIAFTCTCLERLIACSVILWASLEEITSLLPNDSGLRRRARTRSFGQRRKLLQIHDNVMVWFRVQYSSFPPIVTPTAVLWRWLLECEVHGAEP